MTFLKIEWLSYQQHRSDRLNQDYHISLSFFYLGM